MNMTALTHLFRYFVLPFLLLFISPILIFSYGAEATTTQYKQLHPSNFLPHLTGHRKGDTEEGVNQLKHYLHDLGYVIYRNSTISIDSVDDENNPNTFDIDLESALKTYQMNYGLNVTGELDAETVKQLMQPRCGEPDTNFNFKAPRQKRRSRPMGFHAVLHYDFPAGQPKWPKTHLTYRFLNSADQLRPTTSRAFQTWAEVTQFTFEEVTADMGTPDITIGFFSGDHNDGSNFDGPGGVLAHAFHPTDGRLHLDADENWSTDYPGQSQTDLESVTVHEIGHVLGLAHSADQDAVMYAYMLRGAVKRDLRSDDIDGIQALYNL